MMTSATPAFANALVIWGCHTPGLSFVSARPWESFKEPLAVVGLAFD